MSEVKIKNRIPYIDALKGFAIILVVLGHVCNGYVFSMVNNRAIWISRNIYNVIYTFHMPLFMVISGYVFVKAYVDDSLKLNWRKMLRHIANLLVVYIIFSLLHGTIKLFYNDIVTVTISPKDLLMIWKHTIAPYWYLYILIAFYLVFGLLNHFRINPLVYTLIFIPINILSVKLTYVDDFELYRISYYGVFFSIGTLISYFGDGRKLKSVDKRSIIINILSVIALICGIMLIYCSWSDAEYIYQMPYRNALIAVLLIPSCFTVFRIIGFNYKKSLLRYLGKHSLEIYVLHIMFTAMIRYILMTAKVESVLICLIFGTLVGIVFPLVTVKLMEVLWVKKWIFTPFSAVATKENNDKGIN